MRRVRPQIATVSEWYSSWIRQRFNMLVYTYNPCKPSDGSTENCQNVAACQGTNSQIEWPLFFSCIRVFCVADGEDPRSFAISLGSQESATWNAGHDSDENPSVSYSANMRTTHIILKCSTNGSEAFELLREDPEYTYTLRLTHKCACWNGCGSK